MYMLGCRLQAVYPMVPLADHHAVSVGMITVDDQACFGVYADRQALPDVNTLAQDIDDAVTELLAGTYRVQSAGSLLTRARAAVAEPARASAPASDGAVEPHSTHERLDDELGRLADGALPPDQFTTHAGGAVATHAQEPADPSSA